MVWIIDNLVTMVEHFTTAATTDPLSAIGILFGALFVTAAAGAFGALAVGGLISPLVPDSATIQQRR
ncbi:MULTISPECIES: hypothetical protein [Halobacterium]|uniref:Uncharacterized protein n=3 Tax=Halobacterium salinarum TaxID=2242 RepID=Q9HME2_HALSA|nr:MULTISPECIES: hypothetical protein [Halobacterium]AAG20629.1 hypothetical protein VNG_2585H [Halobacterium salinarum NRC-1]MBB6089436.1 hypothetical protein [Halobacterium salinarum]MCF2164578.1 hypothetical protein [Halobacterium salinarum]MCF2166975.1 hypothetical protein [Halobacterium salinarum]MCF2238091.1 hypothetical protein [Halobacterium salinarum]